MGLRPGMTNNPHGRPKGSRNKSSLRQTVEAIISNHFDTAKVEEYLQELEAKDKLTFLLRLLEFSLPKLKSIEYTSEFDYLPDEQLDQIISELKNSINNGHTTSEN